MRSSILLSKLKKILGRTSSALKNFCTNHLIKIPHKILKLLEFVALFCFLLILAMKAPDLHRYFLRQKVGNKTYLITDPDEDGGGTGFAIKAASGKSYIVTNAHVCNTVSYKGHFVVVADDSTGREIVRRIIEISKTTDLCLIEGLEDVKGLSLSSSPPSFGETFYTIGHPYMLPLSLIQGEIIGRQDVSILDHVFKTGSSKLDNELQDDGFMVNNNQCNLPKNVIKIVNHSNKTLKECFDVTKDAYTSTVTVFPGNSGSPIVNWFGDVTGVVFAVDTRTNWANIISFTDLQKFLASY